ncbi:hypothetical protein OESDEN_25494 [Oesophagostomum dentatum]|uniref:C-type lectin domain-containing protein n=1 Tax=Oesophagostomum dentatum TaxID=61180 RepID=A0A0B1RV07_OESDE|nr:hypothetical protein OESDEN_25494 [Oesophagostomum dentatum]
MDIRLFINLCLLTVALAFRRQHYHVQHPKHSNCAPGWTSYRDSCYFYEHHMLTFDKAEVRCLERDSLMFVAETMDEWKEVMKNSPANYYTWVGLKQRIDEHEPKWVSGSGIGAAHLDWLNPAYKGWNENAKCVADSTAPPPRTRTSSSVDLTSTQSASETPPFSITFGTKVTEVSKLVYIRLMLIDFCLFLHYSYALHFIAVGVESMHH